ncbi:hypothetical protein E1B28_003491 [Marasmius oreades]|uniref:Uncharacterized protein n=1 Tax=Marasmius oreades TaxID=181124 RepID=A0A9P7UMI9_9AGAR|nr:uncharacterized protein E1B28_003491 [Marasmius oreades]KAG7085966.1 hypothetical protein E1B28_003491 [Marasmius oreades]
MIHLPPPCPYLTHALLSPYDVQSFTSVLFPAETFDHFSNKILGLSSPTSVNLSVQVRCRGSTHNCLLLPPSAMSRAFSTTVPLISAQDHTMESEGVKLCVRS